MPNGPSLCGGERICLARGRCGRFRQSEIQHLDRSTPGEHDVPWLEIAVHDSFPVRRGQSIRHLNGDRNGLADGQTAFGQSQRQRLALDQLHDQSEDAAALLDSVQRGDVRVIQQSQNPRFAAQPVQVRPVAGRRRRDGFESDVPPQTPVAGAENLAHAAGAETLDNAVGPVTISGP